MSAVNAFISRTIKWFPDHDLAVRDHPAHAAQPVRYIRHRGAQRRNRTEGHQQLVNAGRSIRQGFAKQASIAPISGAALLCSGQPIELRNHRWRRNRCQRTDHLRDARPLDRLTYR